MASLRLCLLLALVCLCQAQSEYENIMKGLSTLVEAFNSHKSELLTNFEEMKEEVKRELGEKIKEARAEFLTMSNQTRSDLSTLQHLLSVDECLELTHNCSTDAKCIDTRVSFRCACKPGFTGDGYTCVDIDECEDEEICGEHTTCVNYPGKYSCVCNPGFKRRNDTCEDIDECLDGKNRCHKYAVCTNTPGGYNCTCTLYHEGDGIDCHEVEMEGCNPPFKAVRGIGCIHIIEKSQNFDTSRSNCKELGGDLFDAVNPEHYLRLAKYFIDTNQKAKKKYMWVGVKGGVWLNGRSVAPEEEAPGNPTMSSSKCSYTDGDTSERFLLWTDPCSNRWWALCEKKSNQNK